MTAYRALRPAPLTERNGQMSYEDGKAVKWHDITRWPAIGIVQANSREHAVQVAHDTFGCRAVIEEIQEPINYVAAN